MGEKFEETSAPPFYESFHSVSSLVSKSFRERFYAV